MNIAFAGLRHGHVFGLYDMAVENDLFTVTGAFESDKEARAAAEEHGIICNYDTFEAVLNDKNVDIIALGGCYTDRGGMAIEALKAGKHVIADKPLCTSLEELDEIEALAKENNLFVSCMFSMRFEKKINAIKKLVESGTLGEINNVYFGGQHPLMYGRRPMWYFEENKHGGVINDIAIHGIDILDYALGLQVENICSAREWNKFADKAPQFKDSAQFMLKCDNNAGVIADVSYSVPNGVEFALPYYWQFFIWGTKGTIAFSFNEEKSYYFITGDSTPHILKETEITTDYLTDFNNMVKGKKNLILSMKNVFKATRKTLEIQKFAIQFIEINP